MARLGAAVARSLTIALFVLRAAVATRAMSIATLLVVVRLFATSAFAQTTHVFSLKGARRVVCQEKGNGNEPSPGLHEFFSNARKRLAKGKGKAERLFKQRQKIALKVYPMSHCVWIDRPMIVPIKGIMPIL